MSVLNLKITDAGRQALVDAENTGTLPLKLSVIALGSGRYTPTGTETALQAEIKPLNTFGAEVVAPDTIHVTITDESADTYTLGEFGLYTDTGVLFAIYSQTSPILEKAANAMMLLSVDVVLTSVTPGSVTIGDTDFILPPATETRQGIVELASNAEALAGTDLVRAMTPKRVHEAFQLYGLGRTAMYSDANSATKSGFYLGSLLAPANVPSAMHGQRTTLLVIGDNMGYTNQLCFSTDTNSPARLFVRRGGSGNWSEWQEVFHAANLKSATDSTAGLVELATNEETQAGTDTSRAVTPAGLASRTATTERTGLVELATDTETLSTTDAQRAVTPRGLSSRKASQDEAEAGINDSKWVSPLGVFQAITKKVTQATEYALGIAKIATQALTDAGVDDTTIVTPKKLRWGFSILLQATGYIALPSWLGGLIIQWGFVNAGTVSEGSVTYPIAFPNRVFAGSITTHYGTSDNSQVIFKSSQVGQNALEDSTINFRWATVNTTRTLAFSWITVGH